MASAAGLAAQIGRARARNGAAPAVPRARDIPDRLRVLLNGTVLVVLWNHLWFQDLASRSLLGSTEDGSLATQVTFLVLGAAMAAALWRLGPGRLRPLATVPLLLCAGWLGVTVLASIEPSLSIRRVILLAIAAMLSAGVLVVARSPRQFALTLAGSALVILVSSCLAVALVPNLAIHSGYDVNAEPSHAGLWRGIFPHKNEAGAAMVILVIVGLYVAAVGHRLLGWTVTVLAAGLLVAAGSKTALLLTPVILVVTALARVFRGPVVRAVLLLGPVVVFSVVSIGSVLVPAIRDRLGAVMTDATFTGRNEIWEFAIDNVFVRPIRGWGYGAFWQTERTMYAGSEQLSWVNTANHAHNAYLDTALIMGFPGLALTLVALMLMPLRDIQRVAGGRDLDPPTLLFVRLWYLGLVSASFETVLYNGNNATCCMFMMAVFGLRLRTRHGMAGRVVQLQS